MVKVRVNDESKEERFKRIAGARTNKILNQLSLLRNCANTGSYSYTSEQVNKIFKALEDELKKAKDSFYNNKKRKRKVEL